MAPRGEVFIKKSEEKAFCWEDFIGMEAHSVSMSEPTSASPDLPKLSFMSANSFGREAGYRGVRTLRDARESIMATFAPSETFPKHIDKFFAEIAEMGFEGVDLWSAHCDPEWMTHDHVTAFREASAKHRLQITSIAGSLPDDLEVIAKLCGVARDIGAPMLGLGCRALPGKITEVEKILSDHGVKLAFENHPNEPTPEVVLEKIGHGKYAHIGATCDTGWWASHGVPVEEAIDKLKDHLFLVHLKNIQPVPPGASVKKKDPGIHEAATFEEGCLDMRSVVRKFKEVGYRGWMSVEYEPPELDPSPSCRNAISLIHQWWAE